MLILTTMDPKLLINSLTKELLNNSNVVGLILVGSQARDIIYQATEYSDLEAYIIVKDKMLEKVEEDLPKLVSKLGQVIFSFKHAIGFVTVYENLFRLELPVIQQSDMSSLFSRPKAQRVKVLIDQTNGELEKSLVNRPETMDFASEFNGKITNFWYWHILAAQYFKKGELYNTRAVLGIQASTLIFLFELLNDPTILLLETNKRIEQFLTVDQLKLLKEISPSYDSKQIELALKKTMDMFSEATQQIKAKYGYNYNQTLEKQVKPRILKLLG